MKWLPFTESLKKLIQNVSEITILILLFDLTIILKLYKSTLETGTKVAVVPNPGLV